MKLDVPLIRQDFDSMDCGLACVSMIMGFYGSDTSTDEIKSEMKVYNYGTFTPELGIYFLKRGYKVIITTFHPGLFFQKDIGETNQEIIREKFEVKLASEKEGNDKIALEYFLEFIKAGGIIEIKIPDESDIESEISEGRPLIANLTANFFEGIKPKLDFHFNVVTGFEANNVFVNDPHWASLGGKKERKMSEFLFGIYAGAGGGYDNCALLKIQKG